jgi:hypothetical protein
MRGGRHTPDGVCIGRESREKDRTRGLDKVIGGLMLETCSMPPVLHSWPGLQGLPCSVELFMSWQQSSPIPSIITMSMVFMGQGSVGA